MRHGRRTKTAPKLEEPEPGARRPSGARGALLASGAAGLASLVVYVLTLSPTVVGGDSGEMLVAACVRGVAHPPGYPLHTLLGHVFSRLPFGSVAWRVNLLSAVCDAAAAALLCHGVARWARSAWAGIASAALFAFSPLVWPYAVSAEVFPLNNLFAAALVDLSVEAVLAPRPSVLPLTAFVVGLGLTNHHTLIFLGAPLLAALVLLEGRAFSLRRAVVVVLAFGGGLLPYAYLPLAAAAHPPLAWGDATTWDGFLTHLLRREYGTFRLASAEVGQGGEMLPRLAHFLRRFDETTLLAGPLLVVVSWTELRRPSPSRRLVLFWSATLAVYLVVFSTLANVRLDEPLHITVQERFWQQALVVACALAGVGFAALGRLAGRRASVVEAALALGAAAALVATGFGPNDLRERRLFRDYGAAVLESMPPHAILLITSDEAIGSVRYVQQIENVRRDVRVIPTGQLTSPWFRGFAAAQLPGVVLPPGDFTARQFIDANIGTAPILLVNKVPWLQTLEEAYHPWPVGLADRVLPRPREPDLASWVREAGESFRRFDPTAGARFAPGTWERYLVDNYWKEYRRFARVVVSTAAPHTGDPAAHRAVVDALEPLVAHDPQLEPEVLKNLGVALQRLSSTDPGAAAKMVLYWRRYLAEGPGTDPDRPAIARAVEQASEPAR